MKDRNLAVGKTDMEVINKPLLIKDIVKYLLGMAKLNEDPRTGNPMLGKDLRELANKLKPYSNKQLQDVKDIFSTHNPSVNEGKHHSRKIELKLPENLYLLSEQLVEEIINNVDFQKSQLVVLGAQRFGIPRSKLDRLSKEEVIESIRSALNHERSIGVISQEARRSGEKRTS